MKRKDKKPAKLQVYVNKQSCKRSGAPRRASRRVSASLNLVFRLSVQTVPNSDHTLKVLQNDDDGLESVFAVCQPHLLPSNFIVRSADGPV